MSVQKTLDELRAAVDRADDAIAAALKIRFEATDEIGSVKRAAGSAVNVPGREAAVLDRVAAVLPRSVAEPVWRAIFSVSKARQESVG